MKKSNTLPNGYRLHQYRVESVLGAGGFGITYMAVHEALRTRAAIKEYFPAEWSYRGNDEISVMANTQGGMPTNDMDDDACYSWGLERFLTEAQILAQISHPGVVRVRDFFEANGTAYIVMDYEDGEPLSRVLQREKTIPEERALRMVHDVLPALETVHSKGYLHRDIKPANLYCCSDGRTILIDFGAARLALGKRSRNVTSVFSPGYSPIEQYLVDGKGYGPWTDIYAIGTVLYHCTTGIPPIEAPARVLDDPLRPATELAAGRYQPLLLQAIDRAMAVRPEKRFQSVAEMQRALQESQLPGKEGEETVKIEVAAVLRSNTSPQPVISTEPAPSEPTVLRPPSATRHHAANATTPTRQRNRLLVGASLIALVAIVGGVAWWQLSAPKLPATATHPSATSQQTTTPHTSQTAQLPAAPQPGQLYTDPVTGMVMVWIPSSCFTMGSPENEADRSGNEKQHKVCVDGFWMGKTEVTNGQFRKFAASHDSGNYGSQSLNGDYQPAVRLGWKDAVAFAQWLSGKSGLKYRLPTEAEWEFAARAGSSEARYWGKDTSTACRYANIYDKTAQQAKALNWANYPCEDGQVAAAPVAQYQANAFGLHDMLGNVAEWTCSEYDSEYSGGEKRCTDATATTGRRVLRGGSWSDYPGLVRFAYRFPAVPEYGKWRSDIGFRLVLEP